MDHIADQEITQHDATEKRRNRPIFLYLLLAGLLLILLWAGLKGWRLYQLSQSLLARQASAELLLESDFSQMDPDEIEQLVYGLRRDVLLLKHEVRPFLPLAGKLGWIPKYGPTIAAAPQLLEMADAGTEAAAYAVRGLKPALIILQDDSRSGSPLAQLVHVLNDAEADIIQSGTAMERLVAARNQIDDVEALNWRLHPLFTLLDDRLPLVETVFRLAPTIPNIMGMEGPKTYLIIAQNQDELRATGGYISGAGVLTVDEGEIVDLEFIDANLIGDWRDKPFDFPPQPLYEFMGLELFLFRDANFWPDFPTSAEQILDLASYSLDTERYDGAIAIDQRFVAALLSVTGPVEVSELDVVVTQDNVIKQLREAWQIGEGEKWNDWIRNRKDFLGPFAAALRNQLETDIGSVDPLYLADTLIDSIERKQLQIYLRDAETAAMLDEIAWDGRLDNPAEHDFLMVVDSNVGYNKVNPRISSSIDYSVFLQAGGDGDARLDLEYVHGGAANDSQCAQGRDKVYAGGSYAELISGCYWNYLRIYAPAGSALLAASQHWAPESAFYNHSGWDQPAGTLREHPAFTTFTNFFLLPERQSLTTSFHYQLPVVVREEGDTHQYQLEVMRQAGVSSKPITIQITLPDRAVFVSATPEPTSLHGNTVQFNAELDRDLLFSVIYRY